jgi:hypothetical protein
VPLAPLDAVIGVLGTARHVLPALARKAGPARIGHWCASESMPVRDAGRRTFGAASGGYASGWPERGSGVASKRRTSPSIAGTAAVAAGLSW